MTTPHTTTGTEPTGAQAAASAPHAPGTTPSRDTAIAVDAVNVQKIFPSAGGEVHALSDVSLRVAPGEFVSLIGPSGCGKSTFMRLIADLDQPTGGELKVFGKPARQARKDQDYGIAFQKAGLLPWRTVIENIALTLQLHGVGAAQRRARVKELLEMVSLEDFGDHHPDQLS